MKKKILFFISIASIFIFLTGCILTEGNPFCGACPIAPLMAIGIFIFTKK